MQKIITSFFSKLGEKFCHNLAEKTEALMRAESCNTTDIARTLSNINGKNFKTNHMSLYRFLQNPNFQIDDMFWRCHVNLIFTCLEERKIIQKGDKIQINIDFTTDEQDFLILSASILLHGKAITIYFSMRNYPKTKGQMSQTKMETAFIKSLRHILSKKYSYIIVADRGFGNQRFANLCVENNFDFVLRINSNLNLKVNNETINLQEYNKTNQKFSAYVSTWKQNYHFTIATKRDSTWFLMSNNSNLPANLIYEQRFKIETGYKDYKSGGYDLEKVKIEKYDRFKRLLYCVVLAHALTSILGDLITNTVNILKKNFAFHLELILVFLRLDITQSEDILRNLVLCLKNISGEF